MRLTKRDMALTKISIPAAIQSVYFRGKRYQYSDYLKIIKQANKDSNKLKEINQGKFFDSISKIHQLNFYNQ